VSTESALEQRLHDLYAVPVPASLDRRVDAALKSRPSGQWNPLRRRAVVSLVVAGILIATAAGPAVRWFDGWGKPFDRLWELATPVDQSVTQGGYRVTIHRAYADRLGVRLATTVEDLEDRWSQIAVDAAEVTDSQGNAYEAWNWSRSRTPFDSTAATWSRFVLPDGLRKGDLDLSVKVTSLAVRTPDPVTDLIDADTIWSSVDGAWTFDVKVPITSGRAVQPEARASESGVTVVLQELGATPSGILARMAVDGLPAIPEGSDNGWYPSIDIDIDGLAFTDDTLPPGILRSDDEITVEIVPGDEIAAERPVDALAGHWKMTVRTFSSSFDPERKSISDRDGPWVLEFDVPSGS
jgi:hypothetical protein